MSNLVNSLHYDNLIDEATSYINSGDLSSTPLEQVLMNDVANDNMEALERHLIDARNMLRDA